MASLNRVQLIGNLGRDAELRYTPGGVAVATLSLATTEHWTDKDGSKKEAVTWHRCVVWDKQAETLAEYLVKGKLIYCEGKLQVKKWTDKNQIERTTTEIRVDRIQLLGGGGKKDEQPVSAGAPSEVSDDDIPF